MVSEPHRLLYLGSVKSFVQTPRRRPMALLNPFFLAEPGGAWVPASESDTDAASRFPDQGLVAWYDPPPDVQPTSFWVFRIAERPRHPSYSQDHLYRALDVASAAEVMDLRNCEDPDEPRQWLTESGVELSYCPSSVLYVWTPDDLWVGPVRLSRRPEGTWIIESSEVEAPLHCHHPCKTDELASITLGGPRFFLPPEQSPGPQLGQVDWASDGVALRRALRFVRRRAPRFTDALGLTQAAIDKGIRLLEEEGLSDRNALLNLQRLQRARKIIATLSRRDELMAEVVGNLLDIPIIDESVKLEVEEARSQALAALNREHSGLTGSISRLREELAQVLVERRAILEGQIPLLENAMAERLAGVLARPQEAVADVLLVRAVASLLGNQVRCAGGSSPGTIGTEHVPPWAAVRDTVVIKDMTGLRQGLRRRFRIRGLPPGAAHVLHASFLCGGVPVVVGFGALSALEAYAQCVAGGRFLWIPVSPATITPDEVFGRVGPQVDSGTGYIQNGLLDMVRSAHRSEEMCLIVLEGANRAPMTAYLDPILHCVEDAWSGARRLALPVPDGLGDGRGLQLEFVAWPPNLLLACTLSEGPATLQPPRHLWTQGTLIHMDALSTDRETEDMRPPDDRGPEQYSSLPLSLWRTWRDEARQVDSSAYQAIAERLRDHELEVPRSFEQFTSRLYGALRQWGLDEREALGQAITHSLLMQTGLGAGQTLTEVVGSDRFDVACLTRLVRLVEGLV